MILTDPDLLCNLIEARIGSLEATVLPDQWDAAIDFLSNIGAVTNGRLLSVVTCRACDDDHPVHLEFDPRTRRRWHFCPVAGRVMVEDDVLATIRVDPEWVLDWLVTAAELVDEVFRERRTRKLPLVNQRTEAGKIRAEIALRHPERDPPAVKTIERHLRKQP
jgi:hypothetical protein